MPTAAAEQFDVIVLGSGIAGLSAALSAQRLGKRTLLLEKSAKMGGSTAYSYGLIWMGLSHLAKRAKVADSREAVLDYMRFLGGGQEIRAHMEQMVDQSPRALKFFEECGIRFRLVDGVADHYAGMTPAARDFGRSIEADLIEGKLLGKWRNKIVRPHNAPYRVRAEELVKWGGMSNASNWDAALMAERERNDVQGLGVGLVSSFLQAALAAGVEVRLAQHVRQLLMDGERVTGVLLRNGKRLLASAGVVIAAGGYESNPDMVSDFDGLPGWQALIPLEMLGDGLVLGTRAGGAIHAIQNSMRLQLGFRVPVADPKIKYEVQAASIIELCSPHTFVVNQAGKRFADESYFQHMAPKLRAYDNVLRRHPNLPCYLIFDQQFAKRYSFAGKPAGAAIPDWVTRARTPAALAKRLGIDAAGLQHTTTLFNQHVEQGKDVEFGRGESKWSLAVEEARAKPRSLGTLDQAPYYGIELFPTGGVSAGLLVSKHSQVLRFDRTPISGLYAVGNSTARTEFGVGYQAGFTLASGMTFGYLAAKHLARQRA